MSKSTKYFELFAALKSGGSKGVAPDALAKTLGFTPGALAVYIHALRHKFGAVIESTRNGRTVTAYRLVNIAEMEAAISPNRRPRNSVTPAKPKALKRKAVKATRAVTKTAKTKTVKASKDDGIVDVIDDMSITEFSDRELDDLRNQLGLA